MATNQGDKAGSSTVPPAKRVIGMVSENTSTAVAPSNCGNKAWTLGDSHSVN